MSTLFRISIFCPDKMGLISAITGKLFDLGANLGDTNFAVLGTGAEYTAVCSIPESVTKTDLEEQLGALPELKNADIRVAPFDLQISHSASAQITHRILVEGGDNPGLVARLSEVFVEFDANIVRLNTEVIPGKPNNLYRIDICVFIPDPSIQACLATVENTASTLQMVCSVESF
ncbi:amino acid-binding protein [bacterium]|nr:amino acid-binding protein [bacterium]